MDVTPEEITRHMACVEASSTFARAERLSRLLRYIVTESLAGRAERLKEYSVAIEVFGRPSSYDPQVDSLVRVQASQLRARLRQYYDAEGGAETVRIEIPKGGYEPVFRRAAAAPESLALLPALPKKWFAYRLGVAVAAAAILTLAAFSLFSRTRVHTTKPDEFPSVAVLPFTDMSPARDQAYLCDGIAEELINTLGRIHGLKVVARTSAFQYQSKSRDVRRIGQELNVRSVLQGSVRRDGSTLRITVQLIDTARGYNVWSAEYDRRLDDTFAVEAEIAEAIAGRLQPRPAGLKADRVAEPDPQAYRHYLTGVYWRTTPSAQHLHNAIGEFRAAASIDPGYAPPYAAMAEAYAKLHYFEIAPAAETAQPAREAAARALQLDDHLARAHEAAALVHLIDWDLGGAEREFRRAIELDSNDVRIRYAYAQLCLNPAGRHQEAVEQLRYALNFDPVARYLITELGATYLMSGQFANAREQFRRSLGFNPQAAGTRTNLAAVAAAEGHFDESLASLEKVNAAMPGDPWVEGYLGYTYAKAGRTAAARRILTELTGTKGTPALHIAAVYVGLGDADHALEWLDRGLSAHAPSMYWLPSDFRFASLRSQAGYAKLEARLP